MPNNVVSQHDTDTTSTTTLLPALLLPPQLLSAGKGRCLLAYNATGATVCCYVCCCLSDLAHRTRNGPCAPTRSPQITLPSRKIASTACVLRTCCSAAAAAAIFVINHPAAPRFCFFCCCCGGGLVLLICCGYRRRVCLSVLALH